MLEEGREAEPCDDHAEVVAGRYRLGPVLRRSPGCCAHRAYDELLRRTVRVTLVQSAPATSSSFALRPQGWHDRDPEVAELYDAGSDAGRLFFVTHHPEEPTLAETTPPEGLDLAQLRDLGASIATTLLPRHRRGAAHGGLDAGTVSFSPGGTSLADFGLLPWLAEWGDVAVTPPFPAPEQRTGTPTGPATDVYALGRLLGELAPQGGLQPDVEELLTDMTADSPAARPSLEEVLRRLTGRDDRSAPSAARVRGRQGRRVGLVAAVACCLVGLGAGLSAFAGSMPHSAATGATLAATAAVPAPVVAPALPPIAARGGGSDDETVAVRSSRSDESESASTGSGDDGTRTSARLVDVVDRTPTAPADGTDTDERTSTTPSTPTTSVPHDDQERAGKSDDPTRSHRTPSSTPDRSRDLGDVLHRVDTVLTHRPGSSKPDAGSSGHTGKATTVSTSSTTGDDAPPAAGHDLLRTLDQEPS